MDRGGARAGAGRPLSLQHQIERGEKLAKKLGPFPHAVIKPLHGLGGVGPERPPVQSTRMLKVMCPGCGYTVRATRKWLDIGVPACPDGDTMEEVRGDE